MLRPVLPVLIAAAMLLAPAPTALAQTPSDPVALVQQLAAAFSRDDRAAVLAMFTDQLIFSGGPCTGSPAGGECDGRADLERALRAGGPAQVTVSNFQVVGEGNTVTFRAEERFQLPPQAVAAGVQRQIELGTAVISGGKIDRIALAIDVTDPQTVTLHRIFGTLPPPPGAGPDATTTSDGQSLATQSAATQALFRAVYGDRAAAQWAGQHQAALGR